MKKITNKGFSFVEIIVTISIITVLWIIAYTTSNTFTNNTDNSKVLSDISTLENSIKHYKTENNWTPIPNWNLKFYLKDTSYAHWLEDNPFWVSGYITENTLAKKYLNFIPLDPRTNQYYAFWKTYWTWSMFEISWVNKIDWNYISIVKWDYTWEKGPYSLIKEYNWNNFVYDNSNNHFPYNPDEKILIWKINYFSWIITLETKESWILTDINKIYNYNLKEWDIINVNTGSTAHINFSDWSQIFLWDTDEKTQLAIANINFKEKNNIFTDIKLVLNIWSIFTKAAKLDSKSNFEVYTSDTVAAVRWTVFWVRKSNSDWTNILVERWAVKIEKNKINTDSFSELIKNIQKNNINKEEIILNWIISTWSIITVNKNESKKWILIKKTDNIFNLPTSSTWIINKIPNNIKNRIINNTEWINNWVKIIINKVSVEDFWINIFIKSNKLIENSDTKLIIDNKYEIKNKDWLWEEVILNRDSNIYRINTNTVESFNNIINNKSNINITFCIKRNDWEEICTENKNINLKKSYISDELKSNNNKKTIELVTLKEEKEKKDVPLNAIPEPKIEIYKWFWCSSCPNWASEMIWNNQYCSDIKTKWQGKVICQLNRVKDVKWEWQRTILDPYTITEIKYWADIINLWNNSSLYSVPRIRSDIKSINIDYWIINANKIIKLRFKWLVDWSWESFDTRWYWRIIPKDEFVINNNWIEIERKTYWSDHIANQYMHENYEYEYDILLDNAWKAKIDFSVQSSTIDETISLTEIKTILSKVITP